MIKDKNMFMKNLTAMMVDFNFKPDGGEAGVKQFAANLYDILSEKFHLTDEQFLKAVNYFFMNGKDKYKRFPSSNDFLDVLGLSPKAMSNKCWPFLKRAIAHFGRGNSVRLGEKRQHMALHETIQHFGGWVAICSKTYNEMERLEPKFKEKFIEIYSNGPKGNIPHLIGQYGGEPIMVSAPKPKQLTDGKDARERLYEEQMKKIGFKEEEE